MIPILTAHSIYELPQRLEETGLGDLVVKKLGLQAQVHPPALDDWQQAVTHLSQTKPVVTIALVGKYVELHDAYMSVRESLIHAALWHAHEVVIDWVHSEDLERGDVAERLSRVDGIVVPGGFGYRGIEGKIMAARFAREQRIPYLGLCLGMQVMCVELARAKLQSNEPNSTEFDRKTRHPVISLMPDQVGIADLGGTMRLGAYPCVVQPGTKAYAAYNGDGTMSVQINERHRHRFEFNNAYRETLGEAGLIFSGLSPDGRLVEIAELRDHPWMVGSQFHPEFKSRLHRPHPLFREFVGAAIREQKSRA